MGRGDPALGVKILTTCLRKLGSYPGLDAIILYNAGVKLAVRGSPVETELRLLADNGVDVLPCGTCVEHYALADRLITEKPGNMVEILDMIEKADKVVTL